MLRATEKEANRIPKEGSKRSRGKNHRVLRLTSISTYTCPFYHLRNGQIDSLYVLLRSFKYVLV